MHFQPTRPRHAVQVLLLAALCAYTASTLAADTTPAEQLARWSMQAARPGNAVQGQQFFASRHGGEWSCASCHGAVPTEAGQHAATGKHIAPLAPAFNPKALTDTARTDKWFRRNCGDVLRRECSPGEKADVLAYLLSLQR
ncbi:DUF1924 domain-containing protein [Acidovorax sp. BL-A-41-H1]|uniref:DUF1924 domain-containing protein n=1 Tax=Acidovorax sp. BL-A-41-H1 TaxID=3421102 RepID=UPI003F794867